ncbi:MAG: DUF460 domain-containing protein [Pyrobaculum sp.]
MAILGLDIAPKGAFAYAVFENDRVIESGVAEARELLPLFKKFRIRTVAVDNVGELAQYGRAVIKALGRLPYMAQLVEVTRGAGGYRNVEQLVKEYLGVNRGRLDPLDTAIYLAMLAARGVGTAVKLFEEETIVLVHRRISTTPGGMSRNRFMRNVAQRIKALASEIETKLRERGLDYDLFLREESGEVSSAKFVVYTNRETVRRLIKPKRSLDVAVSVYSVPARVKEAPAHKRFLVVGIDPGTVTGLAILTLDGEVLDTVARRGFSRGDILRYVGQWGIPVLVATDVGEPPEYVRRLAAMCGAVLYTPGRDLTSGEKMELVEKAGWRVKTSHERDALAAAYRAYLEYRPKFEKISKELGVLDFGQLEYIKALVIRGYSIAHAVSEALRQQEGRETKVVYITVEKPCAPREADHTRIKALEYENQQLQKELETLRREYVELRKFVENEKWKDMKYRELQNRIETLAKALSQKEEEIRNLKKTFIEILAEYGARYKLVHMSEVKQCKGGEAAGTICGNLASIEDADARKTLGVPLRLVAKLELGEFYVVDMDKVRELVRQIRERLDREVDLKKIIREYRGSI